MAKKNSSVQTFSNRFDIVYKAFLQTDGKRLLFDRDYYHLPWYLDDLNKYLTTGIPTARLRSVLEEIGKSREDIASAPLIKFGKVKLFSGGQITIDGQIYDFLQRAPSYDRNCFHFSREAIDLINNAKVDKDAGEYITAAVNSLFSNRENIKLGIDASPADPSCPDRIMYGIFDAEDYYFGKNLKAIMAFRMEDREFSGKLFTELAGGSEYNPGSQSAYGIYDFLPGDSDENKIRSAVSFIVKFSVLYNAGRSPITCVEESGGQKKGKETPNPKSDSADVHHYYISLSKEYINRKKEAETKTALNKDNLELVPTQVSGYLRTQHYGKGNKEIKYIWVDGFIRNQWNTKAAKNFSIN